MPYERVSDLPEGVRNVLPAEAQRVWMKAYNGASENNPKLDEENLAKIAWNAVKMAGYRKSSSGEWVKAMDWQYMAPFAEVDPEKPICILPVGEFERKGRKIKISEADIAEFVANFKKDIPEYGIAVNAEHKDELGKIGRVKELIDKGKEGLFALIEWTKRGLESIKEEAFDYVSPEVAWDYVTNQGKKVGKVIVGLAVTNKPFFGAKVALFSDGRMEEVEVEVEVDNFALKNVYGLKSLAEALEQMQWIVRDARAEEDKELADILDRAAQAVKEALAKAVGALEFEDVGDLGLILFAEAGGGMTDAEKAEFKRVLQSDDMNGMVATHRRLHMWADKGNVLTGATKADMTWMHNQVVEELERRFKKENPDKEYPKHDSPLSYSEEPTTLADLDEDKNKVELMCKATSIWGRMRTRVAKLLKRSSEGGDQLDEEKVAQGIFEKLKGLITKSKEGGSDMGEEITKEKFVEMEGRLKAAEDKATKFADELTAEKKARRLAEFQRLADELVHLPSTGENFAEQLMTWADTLGKEGEKKFLDWLRTIDKALEEAGIFSERGSTGEEERSGVNQFLDAVKKKMGENKELSYEQAVDLVQREHPELANAYLHAHR